MDRKFYHTPILSTHDQVSNFHRIFKKIAKYFAGD
jgi:hypothetical protein